MAQNQNDIQLRINAAVDGLQDIGKLLSELDEVGADTTEASADVEKLNEAMSSLAQQRKLIDSLEQTRGKVAEAEQAMNEAVGEADRLRSAYDDSAQGVEAQRRAAEQAAASAEQASQAYQQQRRELQALQTQYKGVQAETVGARQAWRDAAQRVKDLEAAIEASGEATADQSRQLDQARGAADEARRGYERQAEALSGVRDQLAEQRTVVDRAKQSWEDYRDESRDLNRDLKDSERAFARQGKELDRAQQAADKASTSFQRQGKALDELSEDARGAGVDVDNLADEQQRLDRESRDLEGSVDKLKRRLREYRQEAGRTEGGIRGLSQRLGQGIKRFGAWTVAVGAALAALTVARITRFTNAHAELAQQVDNTSEALGVNAQVLQEFQYAFERLGLGADKAGDLLKDVADKIGDAYENGGGEAKDAIDALGLSIEDLVRLSPDQQLLAISNAMTGLTKAGQVNVLESLANDASLLQPLLANNAEGLRRLAREANQVGAIMTPEQISTLLETEAAVGRITGRLQGLKNRLTSAVAPALTEVADQFDELLSDKPRLIDDLVTAFSGLVRTAGDWATSFLKQKELIQGGMTALIGTFNLAWQSVRTIVNSVKSLFGGVATVFFGFMGGLTTTIRQASELLNRFGLVSDETLKRITEQSNETVQAMYTMARFTKDSAAGAVDAIGTIAQGNLGVLDSAKESADGQVAAHGRVAQSAIDAAMEVSNQREAYDSVAGAAEDSARRRIDAQNLLDQTAINSAVIVGSTANEYEKIAKAAEGIGMSVQELKTGISEAESSLIASFATLVKKGDFTKEQLNTALGSVFDRLGPQARERLQEVVVAMDEAGIQGADALRQQLEGAFESLEDSSTKAADTIREVGGATKETAEETEEANKKVVRSARGIAQWMADGFQATLEAMDALSVRAGNAFRALRGAETTHSGIEGLRDRLIEVNQEIKRLNREALTTMNATGISAWVIGVKRDARELERAFLAQKIAATELFDELQKGVHTGVDLSMTMDDLKQRFDLLDETQLSALEGEISRIRGEVDSLNDSLADTIAAARQELAGLEGDRAEVERLQYLEEQAELQQQLQRAQALGDAEAQRRAQQALELTEQIHQRKLAQIEAENEAEKKAALQREREAASRRQRDEVNQREREAFEREQTAQQVAATRQAARVAQPTRRIEVTVRADSGNAVVYADDERSAENLITALGRDARRTL